MHSSVLVEEEVLVEEDDEVLLEVEVDELLLVLELL